MRAAGDAATAAAEPAATAAGAACANCGAALHGRFCHGCGQDEAAHVGSLRGFLAENLSDLAHVDSRGLRSIRDLLVKPGRLTTSYFEGRRVHYLTPLQMYLIAAALFFLAHSFSPFAVVNGENYSVGSSLGVMTVTEILTPEERAPLVASGVTPELFEERYRATLNNQLPVFLIGVVLAFALAVALLYLRRERNLLKHVVFALHWTAFYLLLMATERAIGAPPGEPTLVSLTLGVIALVWLTLALMRTYPQHWALMLPKVILLFIGFNLLLALWVGSVMALALRAM